MAQENSDISKLFINILNDINLIEKSKFYKKDDSFRKIKKIIKQWYGNYKLNKILTSITLKDLEYLDLEITSFFDQYIESESTKENYSERLYYDFCRLEKIWKNKMVGEKSKRIHQNIINIIN